MTVTLLPRTVVNQKPNVRLSQPQDLFKNLSPSLRDEASERLLTQNWGKPVSLERSNAVVSQLLAERGLATPDCVPA